MLSSRLRAQGKKEEMSFVSVEKINTFLYYIFYVGGFVERGYRLSQQLMEHSYL
jgi:hypothetical protein